MAKQQKVTLGSDKPTTYIKPKEMSVGQKIEGVFRNTYENEEYGTLTHYVETDDESIGINGCGHLNALLKRVPFNTQVTIVYSGKDAYTNKKGREVEAHQFEVLIPEGAELLAGTSDEAEDKILDD